MQNLPLYEEFKLLKSISIEDLDSHTELENPDEWEIDSIIDINDKPPTDIKERVVIGADFGDVKIKVGKKIYITARLVRKIGDRIDKSRIGVIETRVMNIHSSINILNR